MELWELNNYLLGYRNYIKNKEKDIVKLAYYTASFNNSKKSKSLKYYLNQIEGTEKSINKKETKQKLDFAREMDRRINKIQKEGGGNNGI